MLSNKNVEGVQKFLAVFAFVYELRGWYPGGVTLFGAVMDAFGEDGADTATLTALAVAEAAQSYYLILQGQTERGTTNAGAALSRLPESAHLTDRMVVVTTLALGYAYQGRSDEMVQLLEPELAAYDALENRFWVSGIKNWLSFAYILNDQGDLATQLLSEAAEVFDRLDEHYYSTWTLWLQAMLAQYSGQLEDSIRFSARQVERADAIRYPRGSVVAHEMIGDTNIALERFDAAEDAYVDSIRTSETMGMIRDMLGLMVKIAGARVSVGREADAVEMLATVIADPTSTEQVFTQKMSIRENATATLDDIRIGMDEAEYASAYERGTATSFDDVVSVLLGRSTASTAA
jgi:tetratricopeptide (TPR) repeat protein